ncbi:hypothetical protein [Trueperella bernardiae]|uniref:phage tail tube protein n=1 Tax=Trueperella bernardiae TaxID=59561 RepID=UPI002042ED84|nr:hypothetical protein [Trueperella bernardiae]MCM3907607.1 hypothetical protein [Trueperella bernardiae]
MAIPKFMVGAPIEASGALASAPAGTSLPTDAKTKLPEAFNAKAILSDGGWSLNPNRETTDLKMHGGGTARTITESFSEVVTTTLIEGADAEILKLVYGEANVEVAGKKISVKHNAKPNGKRVWALGDRDGDAVRRLVIPNGELFLTGEVVHVHNDMIKYEVEIRCSEDEHGNSSYEYIEDEAE